MAPTLNATPAPPVMVPPAAAPAFLSKAGWGGARIDPLAGDASFRRYFRVHLNGRQAVLMDAPPAKEDVEPFLKVATWLVDNGFRAPRILARDAAQGLLLIEDFGDALMRSVLDADPGRETAVYRAAVDELIRLSRCPAADLNPYDTPSYLREARLLTEWTAPALGLTVDHGGYEAAWRIALDTLGPDALSVTVLRDYHAENILLLDDGGLGLIDFQDALVGHPAYDLVSLLQDARRDVSPALEAAMLDHYAAQTGAGDAFRAAYAVLGAQRNAKIIGIFTRLARRDGKHRYLGLIPRMWPMLERDLTHPALAPVAAWFADNIPPAARAQTIAA